MTQKYFCKLIYSLLFILISGIIYAQKQKKEAATFGKPMIQTADGFIPCVTTEYEAYLKKKNPARLSNKNFEDWLAPKIEQAKARRNTNTVVTIPVVVHIIHDGDAVGTNENIPDAQVLSQIEVINQDFRRMAGTPGHNTHPDGADMEIQFCLAQRDPDGAPTNGINRVNLEMSSFDFMAIETILKPQTQWDPEQYLNIWVCNIGGDMTGVGGFAFFPEASGLQGLEGSLSTAANDGVTMHYLAFGSKDLYPQGNYIPTRDTGRSCSHEIGHFFGLRHIWGDGNSCSATDYCDDTPSAFTMNMECNTIDSCPSGPGNDMIQNHMDYTPDDCKNIFTADQKARMWAVLENSPRRGSLTTSTACIPPQALNLDGSLKIMGMNVGCQNTFNPKIRITNIGLSTLTSATIGYRIDDGAEQTMNWTGSLATGTSEEISLDGLTAAPGTHTFSVNLIAANGGTDESLSNNLKTASFVIEQIPNYNTQNITLTLQQDLFGSEVTWNIKNSTGTVLYSGGPYSDTEEMPALITQTWNLPDNECYTFTISDAFGDGICCWSGDGYYTLKMDNNIIIAQGGDFEMADSTKFGKNMALGTAQYSFEDSLTIYPNPVNNILTLTSGSSGIKGSYSIYNILGQIVQKRDITFESSQNIDVSSLSNGVYVLKIIIDGKEKTMKFIKK